MRARVMCGWMVGGGWVRGQDLEVVGWVSEPTGLFITLTLTTMSRDEAERVAAKEKEEQEKEKRREKKRLKEEAEAAAAEAAEAARAEKRQKEAAKSSSRGSGRVGGRVARSRAGTADSVLAGSSSLGRSGGAGVPPPPPPPPTKPNAKYKSGQMVWLDDGRDWVEAKVVKRTKDGQRLSLKVDGFGICEDVPLDKVHLIYWWGFDWVGCGFKRT